MRGIRDALASGNAFLGTAISATPQQDQAGLALLFPYSPSAGTHTLVQPPPWPASSFQRHAPPSWHCVCTDPNAIEWIRDWFFDCVSTRLELLSFAVGLSSILFWLVAQLPQFIQNVQMQSADALSPWFLFQWLSGDLLNLLGCLLSGNQLATQTYTAIYFIFADCCIISQYVYYQILNREKKELEADCTSEFGGSTNDLTLPLLEGSRTEPRPQTRIIVPSTAQGRVSRATGVGLGPPRPENPAKKMIRRGWGQVKPFKVDPSGERPTSGAIAENRSPSSPRGQPVARHSQWPSGSGSEGIDQALKPRFKASAPGLGPPTSPREAGPAVSPRRATVPRQHHPQAGHLPHVLPYGHHGEHHEHYHPHGTMLAGRSGAAMIAHAHHPHSHGHGQAPVAPGAGTEASGSVAGVSGGPQAQLRQSAVRQAPKAGPGQMIGSNSLQVGAAERGLQKVLKGAEGKSSAAPSRRQLRKVVEVYGLEYGPPMPRSRLTIHHHHPTGDVPAPQALGSSRPTDLTSAPPRRADTGAVDRRQGDREGKAIAGPSHVSGSTAAAGESRIENATTALTSSAAPLQPRNASSGTMGAVAVKLFLKKGDALSEAGQIDLERRADEGSSERRQRFNSGIHGAEDGARPIQNDPSSTTGPGSSSAGPAGLHVEPIGPQSRPQADSTQTSTAGTSSSKSSCSSASKHVGRSSKGVATSHEGLLAVDGLAGDESTCARVELEASGAGHPGAEEGVQQDAQESSSTSGVQGGQWAPRKPAVKLSSAVPVFLLLCVLSLALWVAHRAASGNVLPASGAGVPSAVIRLPWFMGGDLAWQDGAATWQLQGGPSAANRPTADFHGNPAQPLPQPRGSFQYAASSKVLRLGGCIPPKEDVDDSELTQGPAFGRIRTPLAKPAVTDPATDSMVHSIGLLLGWGSAAFYLASRISQIALNAQRGSAEGLSMAMFLCAFCANCTYGIAILLRAHSLDDLTAKAPWLVGSVGTLSLDVSIYLQAWYLNKKHVLGVEREARHDRHKHGLITVLEEQ